MLLQKREQGASPLRIMFSDLLPNIASTVLVLFTLIIATNMITEAGLSYLGAGVRLPNPSWGNLIASGQDQLPTAPWIAPDEMVYALLGKGLYHHGALSILGGATRGACRSLRARREWAPEPSIRRHEGACRRGAARWSGQGPPRHRDLHRPRRRG